MNETGNHLQIVEEQTVMFTSPGPGGHSAKNSIKAAIASNCPVNERRSRSVAGSVTSPTAAHHSPTGRPFQGFQLFGAGRPLQKCADSSSWSKWSRLSSISLIKSMTGLRLLVQVHQRLIWISFHWQHFQFNLKPIKDNAIFVWKKKRERNSKPSVAEEAGPPISFPVADKNNFCLLSVHSAFVSSSSHSASCRHSSLMLATFDTAANDSSAWNAALTVLLHFEFFSKIQNNFK
jgi:hypothetical protein